MGLSDKPRGDVNLRELRKELLNAGVPLREIKKMTPADMAKRQKEYHDRLDGPKGPQAAHGFQNHAPAAAIGVPHIVREAHTDARAFPTAAASMHIDPTAALDPSRFGGRHGNFNMMATNLALTADLTGPGRDPLRDSTAERKRDARMPISSIDAPSTSDETRMARLAAAYGFMEDLNDRTPAPAATRAAHRRPPREGPHHRTRPSPFRTMMTLG